MTRRRRKPLWFTFTAIIGAIVVGLAIGFVAFARTVTVATAPADPRAEGIVVLTGGSARIAGALGLLAEGRAKRLLISGVNPAVSRDTLAAMVGSDLRPVLDCCVDLDHARDTIENAQLTQRWIEKQGFKSLIVVTSDYHMPRSMAELGGAMPDVELISFPVSNPDLKLGDWWRDPATFELLAREYGKFLVAEARQILPLTRPARAAGR
ncbi:MAG: YdcF family protein [Bauldia sp.]|nr:YdcF family protein [Bauldia sp.]